MDRSYNVLYICTGNSARSILAEVVTNRIGKPRFHGYSAGSHPKGEVHPMALEILRDAHLPTQRLRSKSWDEYTRPDAPKMDFVITVCDRAAGEICPIWPGVPMIAHWGVEDPAAVTGSPERVRAAFAAALHLLQRRISIFVSHRIEALDKLALQKTLAEIGQLNDKI